MNTPGAKVAETFKRTFAPPSASNLEVKGRSRESDHNFYTGLTQNISSDEKAGKGAKAQAKGAEKPAAKKAPKK